MPGDGDIELLGAIRRHGVRLALDLGSVTSKAADDILETLAAYCERIVNSGR